MNTLHCSVNTCRHYCDNLCDLNTIDVSGQDACNEDQTCCSSFVEKTSSLQNSNSAVNATPTSKIHCDVTTCYYNENNDCSADSVQVSYSQPGTTTQGGTLCGTFKAK